MPLPGGQAGDGRAQRVSPVQVLAEGWPSAAAGWSGSGQSGSRATWGPRRSARQALSTMPASQPGNRSGSLAGPVPGTPAGTTPGRCCPRRSGWRTAAWRGRGPSAAPLHQQAERHRVAVAGEPDEVAVGDPLLMAPGLAQCRISRCLISQCRISQRDQAGAGELDAEQDHVGVARDQRGDRMAGPFGASGDDDTAVLTDRPARRPMSGDQ